MDIMNVPKMRKQENKDYINTVAIFDQLFGKWETTPAQMPEGYPTDMRYKVEKDGDEHFYNVEIKTRNTDLERYPQLPLTVSKYENVMNDTMGFEKPIYVSLVNDTEYYIFDLSAIDINTVEKRLWHIKRKEYHKDGYEIWDDVPTYFFPISIACAHGIIPK